MDADFQTRFPWALPWSHSPQPGAGAGPAQQNRRLQPESTTPWTRPACLRAPIYDKAEFRFRAPDGVAKLDGILECSIRVRIGERTSDGVRSGIWQAMGGGATRLPSSVRISPDKSAVVLRRRLCRCRQGQRAGSDERDQCLRQAFQAFRNWPARRWCCGACRQASEVNYELAAMEAGTRIAAALSSNKGRFLLHRHRLQATRAVPALLFVLGNDDLQYRITAVTGIFAMNRRPGALWALVQVAEHAACGRAFRRNLHMTLR